MLYFFLVCLISVALAEEAPAQEENSFPGKCPQLNAVENFDINRYASGVWYKVYFHCHSGKQLQQFRCPEIRLQYLPEGERLAIDAYYLNESLPVRWNITQELIKDQPGSYQAVGSDRDRPEWYYRAVHKVLLTDYDNYALIWTCGDIEGSDRHNQLAAVYSRKPSLIWAQYYDLIKAYFAERQLKVDFQYISFDDCRAKCPA